MFFLTETHAGHLGVVAGGWYSSVMCAGGCKRALCRESGNGFPEMKGGSTTVRNWKWGCWKEWCWSRTVASECGWRRGLWDVNRKILQSMQCPCLGFTKKLLQFFFFSLTHVFLMSDFHFTLSSCFYFHHSTAFHHPCFSIYTCSPFVFRCMYFIHATYMSFSYLLITCHASMASCI